MSENRMENMYDMLNILDERYLKLINAANALWKAQCRQSGVNSEAWKFQGEQCFEEIAPCRYIKKQNIGFNGKEVIELQSGNGMVGVLAALLGGNVTTTDQLNFLEQIQNNVSINISRVCRQRIKVRALRWGEDHSNFPTDYDFILGWNIVLPSATHGKLIKTLCHIAKQTTAMYFSGQLRQESTGAFFFEELLPRFFNCDIVDSMEDKDIFVYKIIRKGTHPGMGSQH
ncbi:EEF1A lysine methyltransferase 3-like [Carcharodon carcharias]|uniref:EEF1A lysine methyltransferase 3-like n=1 Tax=Carcharodon carcharias TaxID=13397 RepID=UPI001B7F74B7|nr:EEF1A lysine methyltransferase 3-like [Carcharodon carcharias]